MEGGLVHLCGDCSTEAVQILFHSDSNDWYAAHVGTNPRLVLHIAIVSDVGQGNGY